MKTYKLEIILDDNHEMTVECQNCGFNGLEILGLLCWKIEDIKKQLSGDVKPDIVKRTVIEEEQK